ncbi:unnamed protein product [Larinioides sclopetarius]|uniref:Uncharacterized protein n=1 Tax=Larinioides sclopetarius TaxID=280406 RepID=A0AAV2AGU2_9ARAC
MFRMRVFVVETGCGGMNMRRTAERDPIPPSPIEKMRSARVSFREQVSPIPRTCNRFLPKPALLSKQLPRNSPPPLSGCRCDPTFPLVWRSPLFRRGSPPDRYSPKKEENLNMIKKKGENDLLNKHLRSKFSKKIPVPDGNICETFLPDENIWQVWRSENMNIKNALDYK